MADKQIYIKNKKASFEYEFIDTYQVGIVLRGTEIKSIRNSKASLQEGYCYIANGELYVKNIHIAEYEQGNRFNHEPTRERKLLLKKRELKKIDATMKNAGLTIIPIALYITERGFAKMDIAIAKGKKLHDKRESIKKKDVQREIDRNIK